MKSPVKKQFKKSPESGETKRKTHDSVSSFRALLERDSDMLQNINQQVQVLGVDYNSSGYDSGAGY